MELTTIIFKVVLALSLGGLIGIDRERKKKGYPAGIRTLAFISLLGMLTSFISEISTNTWVFPLILTIILLLIVLGYAITLSKRQKGFGLTSTIIILLTYLIGIISYFDEFQYLAIAIAIITTFMLTSKEILHSFARKMQQTELLDALKFGIVAFVILPLLPNTAIDPWGVIIPYNLWLMVVLILGISFLGYIVSKFLGSKKGLYWSGAIGGLISSTAVTSSLSIISKKNKKFTNVCVKGITIASSIMFIRVLIEAYVINKELSFLLSIPLISSALLGLFSTFLLWKDNGKSTSTKIIKNSPFNFIPAIQFTLFIALILIISTIMNSFFGNSGTYVTSIFAGLIDTDAITLSIASLSGDSIPYLVGRNSILIACLTNTIVKVLLARSIGSKELFQKLLLNFIIMSLPIMGFIFLIF